MMKRLVTICAIFFIVACSAQADLSNGGFETGNFTGWTTVVPGGTSATVVSLHNEVGGQPPPSWTPTEGSYFALLKTGGMNNFATLSQSFTAPAGYVVSFDYFFDWGDYTPYEDISYGELLGPGGAQVHEFFHWGAGGTLLSPNYSNVGWSSQSYTLAAGGIYTLKFGIANNGDSALDSYMGIDNASVVPVPGAVLLGILGLGVAGVKLRKFA